MVRRLTRTEYGNAVRDLLGIELDLASWLPADESIGGFDTIGGALSISPALLDRYLSAAGRISRLALGDPSIGPAFASHTYQAPQATFQDSRMSDDQPFGTRGGLTVRHYFPLDAEYVVRIRLQRNILSYVRGLTEPHALEVRLDGRRVRQITVGGPKQMTPAPLSFTGVILGDPAWEAYAVTADDGLDVRVQATAGTRLLSVAFVDEAIELEGVLQPPLTGLGLSYSEFASSPRGPWGPAIDSVTIDGPYKATGPGDTPSRRRILTCRPKEASPQAADTCARAIVSSLARRAYRRPATDRDVERLMASFRRKGAGDFERGIEAVLERLLVDPSFLFRIERDPPGLQPGATYRLSDLELATRLSLFLWSSIPDEPLLDAAIAGSLKDPATLDGHVRRMLADRRADALVDNFAMQWLSLRELRPVTLDEEIFPDYDGNLREAFLQETRLFLSDQLRRDRGVLELFSATHTFVNERLARHYGIAGVYGSRFRRVTVHDERSGLLGHGSILTATSYPNRTSPVLRGRWLLDTVFGAPPPPPPPNIPSLPEPSAGGRLLTLRQRTERHRTNPVCSGCHVRMDPLGFALENFDAIGRWRAVAENGEKVDASAAFPDGEKFEGLGGIRGLIAKRPDEFARTLTGKLLAYATGRMVDPADAQAVQAIVRAAAGGNYRWSAIILGVVRSAPFQMRQVAS